VADHDRRSGGTKKPRSRAARVHRVRSRSALGRGLHLLRCWEGLLFFSFVIDVYSRRVIGWQLASHMRTDLVLDALRMALSRRRSGADVQLVHHSDAGSQPGLNRSLQHRGLSVSGR